MAHNSEGGDSFSTVTSLKPSSVCISRFTAS